jgi:hypothetical protein
VCPDVCSICAVLSASNACGDAAFPFRIFAKSLTTGQFEGLRQPIGICYFSGGKLEKEKRDGTRGQGAVSGSDKAFSDASCKDGVFSCDDLGFDWWEEGTVMGAG